ncbi:MAG: SDR family oxidoreductase [Gemmatimonadaceae bacterium]|nr:SDR family oxidoreductase [Gemmatimonadaceae bacterium]NUS98976.1 SDR family oxidoreductase [Gemmatimonadaceae bacterium]
MSEQRLVVITGVGRAGQVGEAVAAAFARDGASLALVDRDAEVEARARELAKTGARVRGIVADLTSADDVARAAREALGGSDAPLHALVAAAGGFAMSGPVAESDLAVWNRMFAIGLTTAYLATRAFLPALRRGRGSIVYFGAAAALPGARIANMSAYVAAKAGVLALMQAVAQEERDNGVRANAIAPTMIRTAQNVSEMGADKNYVERESVADAVRWLCSDAARDVTGQTIRLGA